MELGHSPDASADAIWLQYWLPGPPPPTDCRTAGGAKATTTLGLKHEYWKNAIPVTVYRCKACGLLESYARRSSQDAADSA